MLYALSLYRQIFEAAGMYRHLLAAPAVVYEDYAFRVDRAASMAFADVAYLQDL